MSTGAVTLGTLLLALLACVVLVLWVLLPFALFGVKPLLRELIAETRQLRYSLERRPPER
jgi:hypothetical protein